MASLWRQAFDAVERPTAAATEAWVQSESFMDLAAIAVRSQRRVDGELRRAASQWLHACGFASCSDVTKLMNEVGSLAREVRELRHDIAGRELLASLPTAQKREAA
jgi:hypothetical protein